jgi:phosphoserine phosphatase
MNLAGFDSSVASALEKFIIGSAKQSGRKVAVFDADGTLWRGDIGEAFFQEQLKAGTLSNPPKQEQLWDYYWNEVINGDTAKAYGWLAQWNAGRSEQEFNKECDAYFEKHWKSQIFSPVRTLAQSLNDAGFEVWVVSASPKWIVAAGAKLYGIAFDRVVGSAVSVVSGKLTGDLAHEVPYRAGKFRLIERFIQTAPLFAAGNTLWDRELMSASKGIALAICSENESEPNYKSEQQLQDLARERGWLSQRF